MNGAIVGILNLMDKLDVVRFDGAFVHPNCHLTELGKCTRTP